MKFKNKQWTEGIINSLWVLGSWVEVVSYWVSRTLLKCTTVHNKWLIVTASVLVL